MVFANSRGKSACDNPRGKHRENGNKDEVAATLHASNHDSKTTVLMGTNQHIKHKLGASY
jgi:hypothetical protein